MSNFRPNGFDELVKDECHCKNCTRLINLAADAMLEAQRRNCIIQTYTVLPLEVSFTINEPGVVVFIPDEKPPGSCNSEETE